MISDYQPKTSRDLLLDLGVGNFNATLIIETLMMSPRVTEAASSPVMLLVQHIQQVLQQMGATVYANGLIDQPTNLALTKIAGKNWLGRTWFDVTRMVVQAKRNGVNLAGVYPRPMEPLPQSIGLFDLRDVPGGLVTYGVGAFLLYRWLKKRG